MNKSLAIETENLTKVYKRGQPPALDKLTLSVNQGEIFGYLGPNGAGKTTTIRTILDIIRPTSGSARMLGLDVHQHSVELHRRIGFVPGELSLWDNLTANEVIRWVGRVRGGLDLEYLRELTDRLTFDPTKKIRGYSSGNRRKLGLILALMHKPELLILDEPTNGLDPLVQKIFHDLMREVQHEGRTVFLSSHILSEVQAICERVAILRDGQLKAVERVSDLVEVKFHWVTFHFRQPVDPKLVSGVPGVKEVEAENSALRIRLSGDIEPLLQAFRDQYVVDIRTQEPSLEEIFLTFYGDSPSAKRSTQSAKAVKEVA